MPDNRPICSECQLPLLEGEEFCLECCILGAAQFPPGYVATAAGPINSSVARVLLALDQIDAPAS